MIGRLGIAFICGLVVAAGTPTVAEMIFGPGNTVFAQQTSGDAAPPATVNPPAADAPSPQVAPVSPTPAAPSAPPAAQTPQPETPAVTAPATPTAPAPVTEETKDQKIDKADKDSGRPAKELFSAKKTPSPGPAEPIGHYHRGCLAGGIALPVTGPHWQAMRLSRNRNWGHPTLVRYVTNLAERASKATGWPGILVGDLAQPRGGPTPTSHASHQTGLDVDIWYSPMPKRELTREEREDMQPINLVRDDWKGINPQTYTPQHLAFIKAAAQAPEAERVLVNAAIKKKLCETAGKDRDWLKKVRPWYGHHDHIHVRLRCPAGAQACTKQTEVTGDEGCAPKDLEFWFTKALEPKKPGPPKKALMLADLPAACKAVLRAP